MFGSFSVGVMFLSLCCFSRVVHFKSLFYFINLDY
nr:MAG TPA: hypothetical protein [Caudoviricetes sp.]